MKKILYIAPFKDFSGYATAARGYLAALHKNGVNLVARAVKYDQSDKAYTPNKLEKELLTASLNEVDTCLIHTTPNEARFSPGRKNIAIVALETDRCPRYWANQLNKANAVITFCQTSVDAFKNSGVTKPIYKVPHTFDMTSYKLEANPIASTQAPDLLKDRHIFYNISQLSTKKGIDLLLRAYFRAFSTPELKDKVILVLKTYINMGYRDPVKEREAIIGFVNQIKTNMRLPGDNYPKVMIVTDIMKPEQVVRLHLTSDTYVCSSLGEGWNLPAYDALAYGNNLVTTDFGGMGEFAFEDNKPLNKVYQVKYSMEPLFGMIHPDPELYTSRELIGYPSILSLEEQMIKAFNSGKITNRETPKQLMRFDYKIVGKQMLEIVNNV